MTQLVNPRTGHQVNTDDESVEFWRSAGYEVEQPKKAATKKSIKK